MIKHFKAFNKEFDFKGLKKEIEFFERILGKLTSIKSYIMEITGIIGVKDGSINAEHESIFYVMFGQHQLRDEEKFNERVDVLLSQHHNGTITPQDLVKFKSAVDGIFNEHVHVNDKRKTPEQHQTEIEERNRINAEHDTKMKEDNRLREIARKEIVKEYPELLTITNATDNISSRILATKNIRRELDKAYPGHKFSITSDTFSGGDSIDVRWEDGVTEKEVSEIIRKYQEGHFDGMTDMYEYGDRVFNSVFGGAKYVHANRKLSRERYSQVGEELGYHLTFIDDRWNYTIYKEGKEILESLKSTIFQDIKTETYNRSFYCKPETTYPQPEEKIVIGSQSGIQIIENKEKDGIEISFPDKPSAEILSKLKLNGFRWNNRTKVWYKKRSENALIFAKSIAGNNGNGKSIHQEDSSEDGLITQENQTFERGLQAESFQENEQ